MRFFRVVVVEVGRGVCDEVDSGVGGKVGS